MIISNLLKRNDEELKEVRIIEKIFQSIDLKFDHIVVTIEETKDLKDMTIEQLQGILQASKEKFKKKQGIKEQLRKIEVNKKKALTIREGIMSEIEVMVMDEVEISTTTTTLIMPKEKAQSEDEAKVIQDQGMINPKYNAIIVKSLGIMLQNVELQVPELMRE